MILIFTWSGIASFECSTFYYDMPTGYHIYSRKQKEFLCISALAVILMTAEQPIRTLIIIAPFILFILIIFRSKTSVVSMLSIAVSFVIGKMANDYLLGRHFPLKVDYSQASLLISPDKAIDNLFIILKSIWCTLHPLAWLLEVMQ